MGFLGQINDSAAAAQALNVTYNIADFVNKIAFVLACWSCAKADTEAALNAKKEPLLGNWLIKAVFDVMIWAVAFDEAKFVTEGKLLGMSEGCHFASLAILFSDFQVLGAFRTF